MDPLSLVPQHVRVLAQKGAVRGQAGSFPRNLHRPLPWSQPEELAFVAIIDISGYSKLSSYLQEVLGTDSGAKVKELLNKPINVIIKHVHQSGGSVVKFAGDAVIAMWPIDGHEDSSKRTVARRVFKGCLQLIAYFQNYELVIPEKINRSSSSSAASRMGTFNRRESSILPETGRRTSLMPDDIDKGPKKTQPLKIHIGLSADQLQHVHIGYAISPNDSNEVFPRSEYFVCGKGLKNAGILLGLGKPGDLTFDSASYNWVIDAMQTESSFPPVRKGSRELNARYFMVNDTDPVDKYLACLSQALSQTVEASKDVESILTLSTERHQHFTSIIVPYLDDALARSVRTIIPISQSQELDGESPYTVDLTNYDQLRGVAILFVYFPAFNVETIAENKNLEILQKISLIVIEAIRKHQGCLRQFNCDDKSMTALLVWGLEGFAHEQGECYFSMAAAMDMASQLKEVIGSDFAIGATKGTVFAGIIGNSNRSDGTLLGVCVNNAARLMCLDRCKGGILCDDETFKDTSDDFEYDTEIPEVTLKGVAAPVKIYAPLRRKQKGQNVKSQSVSFQGREKETKALNSVVASWLNDVKERVLIEGRSGTGKSATARALENNIRKDASNVLCLGKCPENHQNTPLSVYASITQELFNSIKVKDIKFKDLMVAFQPDCDRSRPSLARLQEETSISSNRGKKDYGINSSYVSSTKLEKKEKGGFGSISVRDLANMPTVSRSANKLPNNPLEIRKQSPEPAKEQEFMSEHRKSSPNAGIGLQVPPSNDGGAPGSMKSSKNNILLSRTNTIGGVMNMELKHVPSANRGTRTDTLRKSHRKAIDTGPKFSEEKIEKLLTGSISLAQLNQHSSCIESQISEIPTPGTIPPISPNELKSRRETVSKKVPHLADIRDMAIQDIVGHLFTSPDCDTFNAIPGLNVSLNATHVTHEVLPRLSVIFAKLFSAVTSTGHRVAILVDDLQWCDSYSLELTHLLMQKCPDVLFVALTRPTDEWKDNRIPLLTKIKTLNEVTCIELGNLDKNAIEAMIKNHITVQPKQVSEIITDEIFNRSQGNPLVAQVLIRILNEDPNIKVVKGILTRTGTSSSANLPSGATAAVVAQFDRLKPEMKTILKYASISGMSFNIQELNEILVKSDEPLSYDKTAGGLEEVIALYDTYQFLKETEIPGIFCFAHYLIQQGILSTMVPSKREEIHAAYSDYFTKRLKKAANKWENIQLIVHHLFQISGQEDRKQIALYTAFLETAEMGMVNEAFEFYEALQNFGKKLVIAKNVYETVREHRLLAFIHFSKRDHVESMTHCKKVLEIAGYNRPVSTFGIFFAFHQPFQAAKQIILCEDELKQMELSESFAKRYFTKAFPINRMRKNSREMHRASVASRRQSAPKQGQNLKTISEIIQTFQLLQQMIPPSLELVNMQTISLILGINFINEHPIQVASYFAELACAIDTIGKTNLAILADKRCDSIVTVMKENNVVADNDLSKLADAALAKIYRSRGCYNWRHSNWEKAAECFRASEQLLSNMGQGFSDTSYFQRNMCDMLFQMSGNLPQVKDNIEEDRKFHLDDVNEQLNGEFLFREAALLTEAGDFEEVVHLYHEAAAFYSVNEEEPLRTLATMLNALRASIGLMQQGMGPQDAEWSEKLVKRAALHLETFHDALDAIPPLQLALTSGIIMSLALLCIEVRITTAGNAARRATLSPVILKLMALSVKTNARSFSKQLTGLSACVRQLCVAVKSLWSNEDSLSTSTRLSGDIKRVLKMVTRGDCLSAHQKRLLIARDFGVRLLNKAKLDEEQQQELQGLLEDFAATGHQLEVMMLDTLSNRA